jgi:hypothetical protein
VGSEHLRLATLPPGDVSLNDDRAARGGFFDVPDFVGMQALNAWLAGHDAGLFLAGPDLDSPRPLLNGIIVKQRPGPHARLNRWDVVTVWVGDGPGDFAGVREPRRPPLRQAAVELDLDDQPGRARG